MPRVHELTDDLLAFWRERHLCTVTTLRADGTPHVVPMGVVLDPAADEEGGVGVAWAITSRHSQKVANLGRRSAVAVCQVDGRRWSTVEGHGEVRADDASVSEAVRRYAERYRQPRENPDRVAIRIRITSAIANV